MAKSADYRQGELDTAKNGGKPASRGWEVLRGSKANADYKAGSAAEANRAHQKNLGEARRGKK